MLNQLQHCEDAGIPIAVVLGESELKRGLVKIRDIVSRQEVEVPRENLVQELREKLKGANTKTMNGPSS